MAWRNAESRLVRIVRLAAGVLIAVSALALAAAPAEARHYRHVPFTTYAHAHHYRHVAHYSGHSSRRWTAVPASPAFSAIVVDANSGRTLYSVAEDGLRHPASITKVMTLYLLFEQLDKGAMTLQTRIPVSEHAAAQEPSKLGVEPGETISVEDAIKAVVTRSANDVAVAIAEAIGQDESSFAEMMTRKAHALGMSSTVYRNASGLPNDEQVTTARDLSILGRSLEERFPRYFKYFSTREFEYAGQTIGNHNHLLGRVDGVDGIKTGYTRASGFNLLTSVHRDGRSLVAVVMGGRSAGARDRIMENLIDDHIAEASTVRTATMVAEAPAPRSRPRPRRSRRRAVPAASGRRRGERSGPRAFGPRRAAAGGGRRQRRGRRRAGAARRRRRARRPAACRACPGSGAQHRPGPRRFARRGPASRRACARAASGAHAGSARLGQGPGCRPKGPGGRNRRCRPRRRSPRPPRRRRSPLARPVKPDDPEDAGSGKGWIIQIGATDDAAKADRASRQGAPAEPLAPRGGQAGHRKSAQGRGHVLSRALRRPRFGLGGNRLPLPQTRRFLLLRRAGLTKEPRAPVLHFSSERPSLVAASEHPWPD